MGLVSGSTVVLLDPPIGSEAEARFVAAVAGAAAGAVVTLPVGDITAAKLLTSKLGAAIETAAEDAEDA